MSDVISQGKPGQQWGICGFVSVLNALHEQGKLEEFGSALSIDQIQQRLGAELITYLKQVDVEKPQLAADILSFTRSFGEPYSKWGIADICNCIKEDTKKPGVALPPSAVQDYMDAVRLKSTLMMLQDPAFTRDALLKHRDCIVGCGRAPKSAAEKGLRHRVYVNKDGCLLSWDKRTDLTKSPLPQAVVDN